MSKKLIASLTLAVLLVGCGNSQQAVSTDTTTQTVETTETAGVTEEESLYPLTMEVYDSEGNIQVQTFQEAPKAVITNNQSSLELLLELGLEESIIGTIALDNPMPEHLQAAFEKVQVITESKTEPAKEVIAGMNPDLVIGRTATFTEDRYGTVTGLNDMGINVYTQLASRMKVEQSLDSILQDVRNVGQIFNIEEKANEFADSLQQRLDTVKEKTSTLNQEPLKVMIMTAYKDGTYTVFGANSSLQNEMLEIVGGVNINEKGGQQSLENLLELNPDVIIYTFNNKNAETDAVAVESLLTNETLQDVTAIKENKIIEVSYTELMGYGHRSVDCIETLASGLYPELFS